MRERERDREREGGRGGGGGRVDRQTDRQMDRLTKGRGRESVRVLQVCDRINCMYAYCAYMGQTEKKLMVFSV